MSKYRILKLPLPLDSQEAASKSYADSLTPAIGGGHITILPFNYNSIGQGTWALSLNATYYLGLWFNSSTADGDNLSYKVYLAKGTYTLMFLYTKRSAGPIVDFDINGVEVASFDTYNVASIYNQRLIKTAIAVATAGLKTLKLRIDGKNPSSGGYQLYFNYVALWRTA